jgi:hypothetical protein
MTSVTTTGTGTSPIAVPRLTQQRTVPATNAAVNQDSRYRTLQLALFAAGAVLMPLGILAICLGWYGTALSHYTYDQNTYLISGGLLGIGLTFLGGFLYFGAWLAKVGADQRAGARQLADTMLVLADLISRQSAGGQGAAEATIADPGAVPVLAGEGSTVHRRDCQLIAHREDLHVLTGHEHDLTTCRVCQPTLV